MPLFGKGKSKGLENLGVDDLENLILESKTEISLLEKDIDRKQEKFNSLMSEGSKTSGSKRIQIAQELETLERKIKDNERKIVDHTKNLELLEEVKESKSSKSPSSINTILSNTDSSKLKSTILKTKTQGKVTQNKRDSILDTVRDLQVDDDEDKAPLGNKYLNMFKEMDKNDSSLEPSKSNYVSKESEKKKESEKGENQTEE